MKVYMIRHGESEGNVLQSVQSNDENLTNTGHDQAKTVANRLKNIHLEKVIASSAVRTKQTAEYIANTKNLKVEAYDILVERKHPTSLIGRPRSSIEFQHYDGLKNKHLHDSNWRYEDSENFFDIIERAKCAKKLIEDEYPKNILVVTHGIFLRYFLGYVIFGNNFVSRLALYFMKFRTTNTGVTVFELEKNEESSIKWTLMTWNDHSHLPS